MCIISLDKPVISYKIQHEILWFTKVWSENGWNWLLDPYSIKNTLMGDRYQHLIKKQDVWGVWRNASPKCILSLVTRCGPSAYSIKCPCVFNYRIRSTDHLTWWSSRNATIFDEPDSHILIPRGYIKAFVYFSEWSESSHHTFES